MTGRSTVRSLSLNEGPHSIMWPHTAQWQLSGPHTAGMPPRRARQLKRSNRASLSEEAWSYMDSPSSPRYHHQASCRVPHTHGQTFTPPPPHTHTLSTDHERGFGPFHRVPHTHTVKDSPSRTHVTQLCFWITRRRPVVGAVMPACTHRTPSAHDQLPS